MARLAEWRQTCESCPSQWEGVLDDGSALYVRYRWGRFTFGTGADLHAAVVAAGEMQALVLGDENDGLMADELARRLLEHVEAIEP